MTVWIGRISVKTNTHGRSKFVSGISSYESFHGMRFNVYCPGHRRKSKTPRSIIYRVIICRFGLSFQVPLWFYKKKCITVILCVYRYRIEKFLIQRLIVVRPFVYENIYGTPLYGFFYGTVIKNYYLTTNRSETTRRAILPVILLHSITARRLLYRDIISIYGFIHLWNTCASFRFFFMTLSKTKLPNDGIKARP